MNVPNNSKILIIDDNIHNLKLVTLNLAMEGFEVFTAIDSDEALHLLEQCQPDVIILDVMMQKLDGWDLCKIIKSNQKFANIPIIFLSARCNLDDIVKGIELGANDYLKKPFHIEELLVRVKNLCRLKNSEDSLKKINYELEELVHERTNKLLEAARYETLGKLAGSIAHDLSNIISSIKMTNQIAALSEDISEVRTNLEDQNNAINMMRHFINNLNYMARIPKPVKTIFQPVKVIENIMNILERKLRRYSVITTISEESADKIYIFGDEGQYAQIILNLAVNSIDAFEMIERMDSRNITITLKNNGDYTLTVFNDNGCGIPENELPKVFDLLYTSKPEGKGSGIGLFTLKEIVAQHNGKVEVSSIAGAGAEFKIWLPAPIYPE